MKLPEFLYVPGSEDFLGAGIIIHTPTLYIGQIFRFTNDMEYFQFEGIKAPVKDHMIYIVFRGDMKGRFKPLEIKPEALMSRMADFYYRTQVMKKPGFFKRFKLC